MPPPPEDRPTTERPSTERPSTEGTTEDNATATQATEDPPRDGSPVRAPLHTATFVTAVAAVRPIGHPFLRITFRGGDLHAFRSVGPDQFVYLLLPPPGHDALTIDGRFGWDDYRAMPEAQRPVGAYYTVRAHRPALTEIDIDVLLHDPPGIASIWAVNARPGAPAALWGPRTAYAWE